MTEENEGGQFSTAIAFAYDSEKSHENASERIACILVEFWNPRPSEYEAGMLRTQPWIAIVWLAVQ